VERLLYQRLNHQCNDTAKQSSRAISKSATGPLERPLHSLRRVTECVWPDYCVYGGGHAYEPSLSKDVLFAADIRLDSIGDPSAL
jgi:hypothetical protein